MIDPKQEPAWFGFDKVLAVLFVVAVSVLGYLRSFGGGPYNQSITGPTFVWLTVLVAIGMIALRFWRHRWRVRVLDRRRQLLNDATKARLEEHEAKTAGEPPI